MSNPTTPVQPAKEAGAPPAGAIDPALLADLVLKFTELKKKNDELSAKLEASPAPAAGAAKPKKKELDWSKISEQDIFNMDIPVPAIEHALETYLDVHLKDKNFHPRWVHKSIHNIGPRLKSGYSFVEEADLDTVYNHPLTFDTSGHYAFDDVICLKIPKSIYFGKIKMNYNRATAIQRGKEVQARNPNKDIDLESISDNPYVSAAQQRGSLQFYEPSAPSLTAANLL